MLENTERRLKSLFKITRTLVGVQGEEERVMKIEKKNKWGRKNQEYIVCAWSDMENALKGELDNKPCPMLPRI